MGPEVPERNRNDRFSLPFAILLPVNADKARLWRKENVNFTLSSNTPVTSDSELNFV